MGRRLPPAATPSRLQIVFRELTYSVNVKKKGGGSARKLILKGLSGVIQPGRVTYVMWVQFLLWAGWALYRRVLQSTHRTALLAGH